MWLKEVGFKDNVHHWWKGISAHDYASFVLVEKLKPLKGFLKIWNPDDFGNLGVNKVRH